MIHRSSYRFEMKAHDLVVVTRLDGEVVLSNGGPGGDGSPGWAITLLPTHLPRIRELVRELEMLKHIEEARAKAADERTA